MASHEVKTKADLLRLIDRAADEGWTELDLAGLGLEELPVEIGKLEGLQTLGLSGNQIIEIPETISQLWKLQILDLQLNQIMEIPKAITQLKELQSLNLNSNQVTEIPETFFKLRKLKYLYLFHNQITEIPETFFRLKRLQNLYFFHNQIMEIPEAISQLKELQTLNLNSNQIIEIPKAISQLKELKILDLSGNRIMKIPETISQLKGLQTLDLQTNQITKIPEAISQLKGLKNLYLNSNQITEIPKSISQLPRLQSLYLDSNQITEIPEEISQLKELQTLDLNNNQITEIPEAISQLKRLQNLCLNSNNIADIPKAISQLQRLQNLCLNSNKITEISEEITQLKELQTLDLKSNQVAEIPRSITQLKRLQSLDLKFNQVAEIPKAIAQLNRLQNLDLHSNQISVLPNWMKGCQLTFKVDLRGNPISIPLEILIHPDKDQYGQQQANEPSALANFYFQTQDPNESKPLQEAKLLIIGEGSAGKTTLAKKIDNVDYELKLEDSENPEKSTKGIEVERWEFPYSNNSSNDTPFRVNVWDFGGQEVYHATHQFFLTNRSCYALVIDSRGDFSAASFYYWLNVVRLLGGDSPVFIVKNEKQDRQCEINEGQLRAEFPNLEKSVCVNFATNRGLDDLKAAIQKHITALPEIDKPWPNTWVRIRNALENYSANYIDLTEYLDLCRTNGITNKSEALQISRLLHELGICLHFQTDLGLKNYVILSPTWATNAVYKVTDTQKVKDDLGRFSREDLDEIWSDNEYADVQDELLALMQKFAICYPLRGEREGSFIAPSLLSIDRPNYKWDETNNLILRYDYEFMPKGLITRLIVEMHELIEPDDNVQGLVWKSGVVLRLGNARAEVIENYNKSELSIRVAGAQRKTLLDWIRREIYKIHSTYPRIIFDELIPCNCEECDGSQEPYQYRMKNLSRRLEKRIYETQCEKSYQAVNVRRLINEVLEPPELRDIEISRDKFSNPQRGNRTTIHAEKVEINQPYQEKPKEMSTFTQNNFGGNNSQNKVEAGATAYIGTNIVTNNPEPKTPTEAAEEIKDLLIQLAKDNPLATEDEKAEHIRKALPPSRLQRITEIVQTAGEAAVETIPGGKIVTAVLKKVREQEANIRKTEDS